MKQGGRHTLGHTCAPLHSLSKSSHSAAGADKSKAGSAAGCA